MNIIENPAHFLSPLLLDLSSCNLSDESEPAGFICINLNLSTDYKTGVTETILQGVPMNESPVDSLVSLPLEVVPREKVLSTILDLSLNPVIQEKAVLLQQCYFFSNRLMADSLEDAGFIDLIEYPEQYFDRFSSTPEDMDLDDSIESINKVLRAGFSGDEWDIAFTVTPAEIQQYLKNHKQ